MPVSFTMFYKDKLITKTREQLYEMYLQSIKDNEMPWEKPWKSSNVFNTVNPISTVHYHGINRMLLGIIASNRNLRMSAGQHSIRSPIRARNIILVRSEP